MADVLKVARSAATNGSNACLSCRKVKMKCRLDPGAEKCQRCVRKSFECVFRQHRRGRRPAAKSQPEPTTANHAEEVLAYSSATMAASAANNSTTGFWADSETFQPPDLLNRQAMKGQFSLQNVLSTTQGMEIPSRPPSAARSRDPIQIGLVNYHIAISLFDGFMKNLNSYVCHLDPNLHTFPYVQEKSCFLFSAVLAVAAKILNPSAYPTLKDHAETLFTESFRRGDKSPEVVQAILILTYWKELDDTRAWLSVGYAIRISMDLGWHKLKPDVDQHRPSEPEPDRRKRRNLERTWLVLFVYDRSISLQTGKPRMIERSRFIESVDTWYKSPLAMASDVLLCAFTSLRLLTSEVFELLEAHRASSSQTETSQVDSLLNILRKQIEAWLENWLRIAENVGCEPCNKFLIQFYGIHLQLLLSSFSLKPPLTLPSTEAAMRTAAIWTSHASAIDMLRLASKPDVSPLLYFAQDSVHVMIAYAAIFLVKLLLCVPRDIRSELEQPTIETIRVTAQSFAQQSAPTRSSCWLQAKFLSNVLREFKDANRAHYQPSMAARRDDAIAANVIGNTGFASSSTEASLTPDMRSTIVDISRTASYRTSTFESSLLESATAQYSSQDYTFSDDAMWEAMFANAGFNIANGTFLPDAYMFRDQGSEE